MYLHKHNGGVPVDLWPAVDAHGLAITRELQCELLFVFILDLFEAGTGSSLVRHGGSVLASNVYLLCQYFQGHLSCLSNLLKGLSLLYTPTARKKENTLILLIMIRIIM